MPGGKLRSGSTLPAPDLTSAPPTPEPHNADYTDLIKYYNRVFICRIEEFAKKLQPGNEGKEVSLVFEASCFLELDFVAKYASREVQHPFASAHSLRPDLRRTIVAIPPIPLSPNALQL